MENDYPECGKLKIFRQETKFLSDKIAEKSRFRELSTDEIQKMGENAISAATKKPQTLVWNYLMERVSDYITIGSPSSR